MAIVPAEIKFYKPETVDDTSSNGGRMSAIALTSGAKNNVWPDVSQSERTAGSTKFRKVFWKVENDADLGLVLPKIFEEQHSPGDDYVVFFAATQVDTQGGITGSERKYGGGQLDANVNSGVNVFDVATENAGENYFQDGDKIRISDKTDINDVGNNEEEHVINGTPTYSVNVATITIVGTLANAYVAVNTRVQSIYEPPATIKGAFDAFVVTSASGLYDEVTPGNIIVDSIGGIEQVWTLTFTSPTAFDITGDTKGSVGSGNTSSDVTPNNPDFTKPYFSMLAAGFSGTYAALDTITFDSAPASVAIWEKRVVPAGAASLASNNVKFALTGESE